MQDHDFSYYFSDYSVLLPPLGLFLMMYEVVILDFVQIDMISVFLLRRVDFLFEHVELLCMHEFKIFDLFLLFFPLILSFLEQFLMLFCDGLLFLLHEIEFIGEVLGLVDNGLVDLKEFLLILLDLN
jgi:hypothetical protein